MWTLQILQYLKNILPYDKHILVLDLQWQNQNQGSNVSGCVNA